jgi:shikimate dehydrogenase
MQVRGPALDDVMRGLSSTPNVDGLRVTMPRKRAVFGHCATSWERATLLHCRLWRHRPSQ